MNSSLLTLIICTFKVSLEYEYYLIGCIPSTFYSNLNGHHDKLFTVVFRLLLHVILVSLLKGLYALFMVLKKCKLNDEYCGEMIREHIRGLGDRDMNDLEQRILDDAKKRAEIEMQCLDKVLLPFLILFYTIRCHKTVPYDYATATIYLYAIFSALLIKAPMGSLKRRLAKQDEAEGTLKFALCWIRQNIEPIILSGGQEWYLEKLMIDLQNFITKSVQLGQCEALLEAIKAAVSYSGVTINYLIIALYLQSQHNAEILPADISQHSFMCLMLINKLDESFGFIELLWKRKAFYERMKEVTNSVCKTITTTVYSGSDVKLDHISIEYPIKLNWIISLDTKASRITWITGPNGCGKSGILRALKGIWHYRGTAELPQNLFIIPQGPFIMRYVDSWTELLSYPNIGGIKSDSNQSEKIRECLCLVGLSQDSLPKTPGEWQRAHLARLLYQQPFIAVCDEPCSHMDTNEILKKIQIMLPHTKFIILSPQFDNSYQNDNISHIKIPARSNDTQNLYLPVPWSSLQAAD